MTFEQLRRSRGRIKIQTTNEDAGRRKLVEKKKKKKKRKGRGRKLKSWQRKKNEGMARLVVVGCDARLVDRSRTRGEIFIIPFKNLHRKIRLTYCAHVAIFSIER